MGFPTTTMNSFLDSTITGTLYVALYTTAPDDDGAGGVECAEPWYARIAHSAWNAAANKARTNNGEIDFGDPTTAVTIVAATVMDAATAGNQVAVSDSFSKAITSAADKLSILDQELTFSTGA